MANFFYVFIAFLQLLLSSQPSQARHSARQSGRTRQEREGTEWKEAVGTKITKHIHIHTLLSKHTRPRNYENYYWK